MQTDSEAECYDGQISKCPERSTTAVFVTHVILPFSSTSSMLSQCPFTTTAYIYLVPICTYCDKQRIS